MGLAGVTDRAMVQSALPQVFQPTVSGVQTSTTAIIVLVFLFQYKLERDREDANVVADSSTPP